MADIINGKMLSFDKFLVFVSVFFLSIPCLSQELGKI
jgi:hypothetical protein